jgi:SAM-dependent methyltransferase
MAGSRDMAFGQYLRHKLASISVLRVAWRTALVLRDELRWRPVTQSRYAEIFAGHTDPWGYDVIPFELEKFQTALELLDGVRNDARFRQAWEIGCAEGAFTVRLAQICDRLSAVDFVTVVLERARLRCREFINVSFSKWDLKSDPASGAFDLIVIMDVFGCLSARDIRRAREKLVNALAPGGYLLFGDCLGELNRRRIQDSWCGRLLLRGPRNIRRFVAAHPALIEVARRETPMHLLALFRRHGAVPLSGHLSSSSSKVA